jgi:Domain of unknown function (DUF222)
MFDVQLPDVEAVCGLDGAGLVDVMRDAARVESAAIARKLAAVAELYQRRLAEQDAEDREQWCIDGWEQVAAEVAAAQGISRGRAAGQLRYGLALAERFPKLAALFAAGDVDFRVVSAVVFRSELMIDGAALTRLDGWLARNASRTDDAGSSADESRRPRRSQQVGARNQRSADRRRPERPRGFQPVTTRRPFKQLERQRTRRTRRTRVRRRSWQARRA